MKTPYSPGYYPPAPVLWVSLSAPDGGARIGPYPALVDTGADGTFVPTALLEELQVPVIHATNVHSHLGDDLRRVAVYKVDLSVGASLPAVEVVGDDWGHEIILGRNVLNKLQLLLDGPQQVTELK